MPSVLFVTFDLVLYRYMLSEQNPFNTEPATIIYTLPVHEQGVDSYRCGALRPAEMIRALAFIYGIQDTAAYKSFDLRVLILDNCNNVLRIDQDLFNLLTKGKLCNTQFDLADNTRIDASTVVGVQTIGSRFVVAANRVTAPLKIQLMSSTATASRLSDERVYPYFARTIAQDTLQMEVVAKLLESNDWTYVSVLYSEEPYGINGFRDLRDLTRDTGYSCIGFSEALRDLTSMTQIKEALARMDRVQGSNVIVLIVVENVRNILDALIEMGLASKYVVIGSDSWGVQSYITDDIWEHFRGALTIHPRDAVHTGFLQWLNELTYTNRYGIPDSWFDEFYQRIHKCQLLDSPQRLEEYSTICTNDLEIQPSQIDGLGIGIREIAAAYALDQGLGRFENRCDGNTFAECMADVEDARDKLFDYTLGVNWEIPRRSLDPEVDLTLTLGDKRYWDTGYNIYTIKDDNTYEAIGTSSGDDFFFNMSRYMTYKDDDFQSKCPVNRYCDCNVDDFGHKQVIQSVSPKAQPRNYFMYEESTDMDPMYTWPVWAITVAVLSCIGIVVGLILFFYFLVAYPIRGGTTVLGFMMMIGVFGIYGINFAFFLPASAATCGAREFVLGVVYSIVFAALLIKSVDNWRFKDIDYRSKQYYRGLSNPCLMVTLALGIVLIQCIIPIEWLTLKHPSASRMADATDRHDWMWCDPHDFYDISLVLSMSFVLFLVIITAIFAALSWDSESNYYESRWILVACVCTAGCFLVWMVVSTNAGPPYRDPAVAIANFVNATALLVLIPMRKLLLLIQFKSEEEKYKLTNGGENNTDREMYSTVYPNEAYESELSTVDRKTLPADEY